MRNFTAMAVLSLLGLLGCTRGASQDSSVQLSFSSESLSAQSSDLGTVIINVTGNGIPAPIYLQWDRENCGSANCPVPASFNVSVPSGANRLIQVLAVYKADAGVMDFKYADLSKNLNAGTVEVELTPVSIGNATTEGHIYGRYLNQGGVSPSGPTGILEARFKPPGMNRPSMLIMSNYMFNGWFNAFVLDGDARFEYILNGEALLKDLHIGSPELNGASSRIVKIDVPAYDRARSENGGMVYETESPQKFFLGYFGPAAGAEIACYDNSPNVNISGAFQVGNPGSPFVWNGAALAASNTAVKYAWRESGGLGFNAGSAGSVCLSDATDFSNHLIFRHRNLNNGHDGLSGMRGPFRAMTANGYDTFLKASMINANLTLDWEYLPGAASAQSVTASRVMLRKRVAGGDHSGSRGMGDGVDCTKLAGLGFSQLGTDVAEPASEMTALIVGYTSLNDYDIVLCPMVGNRRLTNAGLALEGGSSMNMSVPQFKIVGTTANLTDVYGPGLRPGVRLLKSHAVAGYYKIIMQANGRFVTASQVTSVQAQFDGSGPWINVTAADYNFGSNSGTFLAVALNSAFRSLSTSMSDATADTSVKFRVNLAAGHDASLPDSFESESVMLVGSTNCGVPGAIVPEVSGSAVSPAGLLGPLLNANGSDQSVSFKLRWSGCAAGGAVYAPFDYLSVATSSMNPANCFSSADIKRDPADSLNVIIDPKDSASADCAMTVLDLKFRTPDSGVATSMIHIQSPTATILHSTVPARYAVAAASSDLSSSGDHKLFYEMSLLGANVMFDAHAFKLNSDGRLINTSTGSIPGDVVSWAAGAIAGWFNAILPTANDHLNLTTASVPSGGPLRALTATGPQSGQTALGVMASHTVLASSSEEIDGGSPLMMMSDGATVKIAFVPSNNGNFSGQSVKFLNLPADANFTAGGDFHKIFVVNGSGGRHVFAVIGRGATSTQYIFGRILGFGSSMSVNWAPSSSVVGEDIADVTISEDASPRPVIQRFHSTYDVLFGTFPSFNGTVWSAGGAIGTPSAVSLSAEGFQGNIGLARCGTELFAVGFGTGQAFKAKSLNTGVGSLGTTLSHSVVMNGSHVTCLAVNNGARFFVITDPATALNSAVVAFEGASPVCAGTANTPLNTTSATLPLPESSAGIRGVAALEKGIQSGFYFAYQGTSGVSYVSFASASCGSGYAAIGSAVVEGTFTPAASSFQGLTLLKDNGTGARLALFGEKQYYQMRH